MTDLEFILGLMRQNTDAVGFIPRTGVQDYLQNRSHILIPHKGYLLYGNPHPYRVLTVAQACVEYDLRERGYGRQMVEQMISHAEQHYVSAIILRCASNLDANLFWGGMGFEHIRTLHPDNRRRRAINVWRRYITPGLFDLRMEHGKDLP